MALLSVGILPVNHLSFSYSLSSGCRLISNVINDIKTNVVFKPLRALYILNGKEKERSREGEKVRNTDRRGAYKQWMNETWLCLKSETTIKITWAFPQLKQHSKSMCTLWIFCLGFFFCVFVCVLRSSFHIFLRQCARLLIDSDNTIFTWMLSLPFARLPTNNAFLAPSNQCHCLSHGTFYYSIHAIIMNNNNYKQKTEQQKQKIIANGTSCVHIHWNKCVASEAKRRAGG